ncbi:helix-turn-helix domain-containing protein [Streptomyces sp. NPDC127108]|uniref:helix-turn-helix domain-containing protein n=1 Tax=Streptomyces sp. NPDC127108 TaxID=3345361 RepID=UPI003634C951
MSTFHPFADGSLCREPIYRKANFLKFAHRKKPFLVARAAGRQHGLPGPDRVVADARVLDREGESAMSQHAAVMTPGQAGSAVGRTLAVLRALRRLGPGSHPLAAIAAQAALPSPTAHRYVQALVDEGAVERQGPRGHYAFVETPHLFSDFPLGMSGPPTGLASATVRTELITLQSRTGQIALAYAALLIGRPMRVHAEMALGAHAQQLYAAPQASLQALWRAPLEADAPGWAILACLGDIGAARPSLHRIREDGYAIGPSPLHDKDIIASPVWRGSTVAGAVSLLASHRQVRSDAVRNRFAVAVMDAAGAISRQLTRTGARALAN